MVTWVWPLFAFMVLSCALVFRDRLIEWSWDLKRYLDKLEAHRPWISILGCAYGVFITLGGLWFIRRGLAKAPLAWFIALACALVQTVMGAILSRAYLQERARRQSKGSAYIGEGGTEGEQLESTNPVARFVARLAEYEMGVALATLVLALVLLLACLFLEWPR